MAALTHRRLTCDAWQLSKQGNPLTAKHVQCGALSTGCSYCLWFKGNHLVQPGGFWLHPPVASFPTIWFKMFSLVQFLTCRFVFVWFWQPSAREATAGRCRGRMVRVRFLCRTPQTVTGDFLLCKMIKHAQGQPKTKLFSVVSGDTWNTQKICSILWSINTIVTVASFWKNTFKESNIYDTGHTYASTISPVSLLVSLIWPNEDKV